MVENSAQEIKAGTLEHLAWAQDQDRRSRGEERLALFGPPTAPICRCRAGSH